MAGNDQNKHTGNQIHYAKTNAPAFHPIIHSILTNYNKRKSDSPTNYFSVFYGSISALSATHVLFFLAVKVPLETKLVCTAQRKRVYSDPLYCFSER